MSKYRLVTSIEFDDEEWYGDVEKIIVAAKAIIQGCACLHPLYQKHTQVTLVRDGDRSGGNLLVPRLQGQTGQHLQNGKASLQDVFTKEELEQDI